MHLAPNYAHGVKEGKPVGIIVRIEYGLVHQTADGEVGHHKSVELLAHQIVSFAAQLSAFPCRELRKPSRGIVPPAHWRLDTIPRYLTTEEMDRFPGTFDQQRVDGRRDYAMAGYLLDMGLRGCEVTAIQLDDIKWREGTLTISHGKSRRANVLPFMKPDGEHSVLCWPGPCATALSTRYAKPHTLWGGALPAST